MTLVSSYRVWCRYQEADKVDICGGFSHTHTQTHIFDTTKMNSITLSIDNQDLLDLPCEYWMFFGCYCTFSFGKIFFFRKIFQMTILRRNIRCLKLSWLETEDPISPHPTPFLPMVNGLTNTNWTKTLLYFQTPAWWCNYGFLLHFPFNSPLETCRSCLFHFYAIRELPLRIFPPFAISIFFSSCCFILKICYR